MSIFFGNLFSNVAVVATAGSFADTGAAEAVDNAVSTRIAAIDTDTVDATSGGDIRFGY